MSGINVIGGGLAGVEAAYHIAGQGIKVRLYEMRPHTGTPAHRSSYLAELVCSNSLKSTLPTTAQGLLKNEIKMLGSIILGCAEKTRVPAGNALAVDRELFARLVTEEIARHPLIEIIRDEVTRIDRSRVNVIATGPLTSDAMSHTLKRITGEENLYFYDAIAPSVHFYSLDQSKMFKGSRYDKGDDDYWNCPLTREEYERFHHELLQADIKEGHSIDRKHFFPACMPVEVLAHSGIDTMRFGPMRPVGLSGPDKKSHYAVLQLRQEDRQGNIFGLVGFQTRLKWGEQDRILRIIPALRHAEFVRYGAMHRNTFVNSPKILAPTMQLRDFPGIFLAGQITGVEGYMESAATGIIAGMNAVRYFNGKKMQELPGNTMIGALITFITSGKARFFQPINASFGLLPELEHRVKDKKARYERYVKRAEQEMLNFLNSI